MRVDSFENCSNPMAKVSSLLTAFLWQRGDVAEAKHAVNFTVDEDIIHSPKLLGAIGSGYNLLFMLNRIGSSYDGSVRSQALNVPVSSFAGAQSKGMYAVLKEERQEQKRILSGMVDQLKVTGYLPSGNMTDVQTGVFQSDTGEIISDVKRHTMTVVTPRFEGTVQKSSEVVKLDALMIESNSTPCSISAISLNHSESLRNSKRILLVIATMFVAENSVWSNNNMEAQLDVGDMQVLNRSGQFKINLETNNQQPPKVYVLNVNGSREREIPAVFNNGQLSLDIDTSNLEYGTPYLEILYP